MMNQAALPETADSTEIERRNKEAAQAEGVATGAALVIIEEFAIDIHRIADALEKMAANVAAVRIDPA